MRIIFLGTNGWFDSTTGNTISTLIVTRDFNIILDAGNGIAKLSRYIDDSKPTYLFISHFHLDHVEGLHTLGMNKFPNGLSFILQDGGTAVLDTLLSMPFTAPRQSLGFSTSMIETGMIETVQKGCKLPFKAAFLPMAHSPLSQGIRIEIDGKVITHCLDTGYCENAVTLAKDADLLIIECTLKPGVRVDHHLCPELCARIAEESGAHLLALTHFEGKSYPDMETRLESEKLVKKLFPNAFMCRDDMEIDL